MTPTTTSSDHIKTGGTVQHSDDVSTQPTTSYQGMAVGTSDTSSVVADDGSIKSLPQVSLKDRDITDATTETEKTSLPDGLEIKPWHQQEPYKSINSLLDDHGFGTRYFLGEGSTSKAYTTRTKSSPGLVVKITCPDFLQDDPNGEFTLDLSRGEACAMELSPHSGLTRNYALILKAKGKDEFFITHEPWEIPLGTREHFQVAGVISEKAPGQTLANTTIRKQEHMISIASQLADTITQLTEQHTLHRDISTKNVIADYSGNAKIIDFATMKSVPPLGRTVSIKGAPIIMCPAILRNLLMKDHGVTSSGNHEPVQVQQKGGSNTKKVEFDPIDYGSDCDDWSLGTLMMEMTTELCPVDYNSKTGSSILAKSDR